jgi:GMP synthase-like glutamine amidotransferase
VDRSEAELFRRWLPEECVSTAVYLHFGDSFPDPLDYSHVVHSGSSLSICSDTPYLEGAEETVRRCVESGIPQMGICYGHQLLARSILGPSSIGKCPGGPEAGWIDVEMTASGLDIPGAYPVIRVLQSHFDCVLRVPESSEIISTNSHTAIQGFLDMRRKLFGLQFHPEFTREEGNGLFIKDAGLLQDNGIDLGSILDSGPSIDTGNVFFRYFFSTFPVGSGSVTKERSCR